MSPEETDRLLSSYASGTLSADEESLLIQKAVSDQTVFDQLMDQCEIQEILDLPGARQVLTTNLQNELAGSSAVWNKLWGLLFGWPGRTLAVALATLGLALLILPVRRQQTSGVEPLAANSPLSTTLQAAVRLPQRTAIGLSIGMNHDGDRPLYRQRDRLRFQVTAAADSGLIAIEISDGGSRVLLSSGSLDLILLQGNRPTYLPPEGQDGLEVTGSTGARRIRMILLPRGVGLPRADRWQDVADRVTIKDVEYVVVSE